MNDWIDEGTIPLYSPMVTVMLRRGVSVPHPIVEEYDAQSGDHS